MFGEVIQFPQLFSCSNKITRQIPGFNWLKLLFTHFASHIINNTSNYMHGINMVYKSIIIMIIPYQTIPLIMSQNSFRPQTMQPETWIQNPKLQYLKPRPEKLIDNLESCGQTKMGTNQTSVIPFSASVYCDCPDEKRGQSIQWNLAEIASNFCVFYFFTKYLFIRDFHKSVQLTNRICYWQLVDLWKK